MLWMILGAGLLILGTADLAWTTLAPSGGGGPVTARAAHWLWEAVRPSDPSRVNHRVLRFTGIGIVIVTLGTWMALVWAGWALVVHGTGDAVVEATTGAPASTVERLYFAGTTLSTLGPGDFVAGTPGWRIVSAVMSMSGLGFATLAITYLVPVIGAVTQRRTLALSIDALGSDPHDVVERACVEGSFEGFERYLPSLLPELTRLGQQHLAYPILHYMHEMSVEACGPVKIAVLDEALTLLTHGLDPDHRPRRQAIEPVREAISSVLSTLTTAYIDTAGEAPPPPSLEPLRRHGLPVVGDDAFHETLREHASRRRALLAFVQDDGWSWEDVYPPRSEQSFSMLGPSEPARA